MKEAEPRKLLMFGDELAQPSLDLIEGENKDYFITKDEEQKNCLIQYDNFRRNNKKYYKKPPHNKLKKGDLIWILNRKDQYPRSLRVPYTGPYRITKMYPLGATSQHVVNGEVLFAHYKHSSSAHRENHTNLIILTLYLKRPMWTNHKFSKLIN